MAHSYTRIINASYKIERYVKSKVLRYLVKSFVEGFVIIETVW